MSLSCERQNRRIGALSASEGGRRRRFWREERSSDRQRTVRREGEKGAQTTQVQLQQSSQEPRDPEQHHLEVVPFDHSEVGHGVLSHAEFQPGMAAGEEGRRGVEEEEQQSQGLWQLSVQHHQEHQGLLCGALRMFKAEARGDKEGNVEGRGASRGADSLEAEEVSVKVVPHGAHGFLHLRSEHVLGNHVRLAIARDLQGPRGGLGVRGMGDTTTAPHSSGSFVTLNTHLLVS